MVFSQYIKLASVEDYRCVTSFYLDSLFSFTHLHICQIFIHNLNLFSCYTQNFKVEASNLYLFCSETSKVVILHNGVILRQFQAS